MDINEDELPVIDLENLPPDQVLNPMLTSYGFSSSLEDDDDDIENMIEDYDPDDQEESHEELEPDDADEEGDFDYDIEDDD